MKDEIVICDECNSQYFKHSSKMMSLCPECAYTLYSYANCKHRWQNGRCLDCHWDGSKSKYIKLDS